MKMSNNYIIDWLEVGENKIPKVGTVLQLSDWLGAIKVRWAFDRMDYKVDPGLYAVGSPDSNAPVLVTANYKLSFDALRKELSDIDTWILVLDTKGINVWCAAGKGTFGTDELVNRVKEVGLERVVKHKNLVLPQLGAPNISAHKVKKMSGFKVIYGPVRAKDLPYFLRNDMKALPEMRQVLFSFYDRLVLIPVEFIISFKYLFYIAIGFILFSGFSKSGYSFALLVDVGKVSVLNLFFAYLAGTFVGPILLPWLPGRSFSFKGMIAGVLVFAVSLLINSSLSTYDILAWMLMFAGFSSFLTMNYTGTSTYTSLSGVIKEMKVAMPLQIIAVVFGVVFWITSRFM